MCHAVCLRLINRFGCHVRDMRRIQAYDIPYNHIAAENGVRGARSHHTFDIFDVFMAYPQPYHSFRLSRILRFSIFFR